MWSDRELIHMTQAIKRIAFGLVITVVFFSAVEVCARAYSSVRHRGSPWAYGQTFLSKVIQGTVRFQDQYPFTAVQEQLDTTDWMFRNRNADDPDVHMAELEPTNVLSGGVTSHLNRFGLRGPDFSGDPAA